MDPDQFYCYPTAGEDGLIYNAIQFEKMDIVVFDPKERKKIHSFHPEKKSRTRHSRKGGRAVYAKLSTRDAWLRIDGGQLVPVAQSDILPEKPSGCRAFQIENQES
jgi:hypothetical protein